ncbi:hypothetical protein FACS18945_4510 [Bacteroidia bacterium]|nr:hypothetical protein FACS18945_4510 [Bacteroidia bacterium]
MKKIIGILALTALCACASAPKNPLKGHEYKAIEDETTITLNFDESANRVHGKIINSYNAPYELNGDSIIFKPVAATMMMPFGKSAKIEQKYFKFLGDNNPKSFEISGGKLTLQNADGDKWIFEKVK